MHPTPHDAFVKAMLSDVTRAAELLRLACEDDLSAQIDFSTLRPEPGSFVDDRLREQHVDRLFSVALAGRDARIYFLYEHKSWPERWTGVSLLAYVARILEAELRADPTREALPPILSIVLYHGDRPWAHPTRLRDLFAFPPGAPPGLRELTPELCFRVTDLSPGGTPMIVRGALRASTELMLSALQLARTEQSLAELLRGWWELLRSVWKEPDGALAIDLVLRYLAEVRDLRDREIIEVIAHEVGPREARSMQTLVEMWRQEGHQKGRQEGRQEGRREGRQEGLRSLLVRQLQRRFGPLPARVLAQIDAADDATLERWGEELLSARSLRRLFPG